VCGIAGFVARSAVGDLSSMLTQIARRGPDARGEWRSESQGWHVALGHTRLAILDIRGGAQPMGTDSTSVEANSVLTYNGELYNFQELRRALESRGIIFHTRSDTEVVLRHVATHWTAGLPALSGMFAFALWDAPRRSLLLVRDRVGIKPLYYAALPDGGVAFGSELTAVLAHGSLRRELSPEGLRSYFFCDYAHPPDTLVRGVLKLPPGHFVEWRDGKLTEATPFWRLELEPGRTPASGRPGALARELWARLGAAVERQLIADVPIGVFLSGGVDSSSVAALAEQRAQRRLKTFSIAFEDPSFDESQHARLVARHIGSEHVEERLTEANLLEVVDLALSRLDEPLADPSFLPTFLLSRLASRHVKVVLGGDGGDELFGGYPTYRAHRYARLANLLPVGAPSLRRVIARLQDRDRYQSLEWKLKRFVLRWDDDDRVRHFRWMSNLDLEDLRRGVWCSSQSPPGPLAGHYPVTEDSMNGILALDFLSYLPGSVLTKVDRASMAHGLEVRPPLLDNEIVDWAFTLPSSLKVRGGQSKYLLKRAAKGHLPARIIHRPKKGFGIPLGRWLRGPLQGRLARALEPSALWDTGQLDREAFLGWSRMHAARAGDFSKALWALIVLDEWVRREKIEPARS
jgi:asparagine synthase (glutamine-hydrolysing)